MGEESGHNNSAAPSRELLAAAESGDLEAQKALGRMMFEHDTAEGYAQSRHWSELAAAQGSASAITRLGTIYHEGLGVERDPQRAAELFLRAARAGHPGAQLMIGVAYHVGAGVEASRLEAAFWLSAASAENDLARIYLEMKVGPELTPAEKTAIETRLRMDGMKSR